MTRASGKLVTIKISHCYKVYRKGCNSYKQCVVSILLQHVSVVTILLQHIILVTMRIGCNNVKIKYLLLQRLRNVVTQIFVATMNGICCNWQIFGPDLFQYSSSEQRFMRTFSFLDALASLVFKLSQSCLLYTSPSPRDS